MRPPRLRYNPQTREYTLLYADAIKAKVFTILSEAVKALLLARANWEAKSL